MSCLFQVTTIEDQPTGEEIDVLDSGTHVTIEFNKEENVETVSVGKTTVMVCGEVSKYKQFEIMHTLFIYANCEQVCYDT